APEHSSEAPAAVPSPAACRLICVACRSCLDLYLYFKCTRTTGNQEVEISQNAFSPILLKRLRFSLIGAPRFTQAGCPNIVDKLQRFSVLDDVFLHVSTYGSI